MKIHKSFIPQALAFLVNWLLVLQAKLSIHGITLGMTAAQVSELQSQIGNFLTQSANVEQKRNELQSLIEQRNTVKKTLLGTIRAWVKKWKAHDNYTSAIGEDMDIVPESTVVNPDTYKPVLLATPFSGYVKVEFRKTGLDGINLYGRLKGEPDWKFVARANASPFQDARPLSEAGTPEAREFTAFGVKNDQQFGQGSDVACVVFGG